MGFRSCDTENAAHRRQCFSATNHGQRRSHPATVNCSTTLTGDYRRGEGIPGSDGPVALWRIGDGRDLHAVVPILPPCELR